MDDDQIAREIVAAWSRAPEFFRDGCKAFVAWVKDYGEEIGRLSRERACPSDRVCGTGSDTDHYCLPSKCQGSWRPLDLCHPCGSFGLGADIVTPYAPITIKDDRHVLVSMSPEQVRAHDAMILWRVYASNARLMLAVSGRDSLFDELVEIYPDFDLRRFLMNLGALLDGRAGPAIVSDAWSRVREQLPHRAPVGEIPGLILERLRRLPEHRGLTKPQLLDWLQDADAARSEGREPIFIGEDTLKDHLQKLKPYGVRNAPRIGYYAR
jgi:hypothetical protein